ncbi:hypothetical protein [uncultured Cellulomonas sp.]|uniref:hypothetical protein n=1 Tax=uncultured Cellulomonas sp. TaxID=189682 RepID=UPI002609BAF5|nr:hypothetical protein [uncultured Cellulomonas sp.]
MKLGLALRELHRSENDLAHELLTVADRHKVDHEIFYIGRDIAAWSQHHVTEIATIARDYGEDLDPEPQGEPALMEKVWERTSDVLGRDSAPELLLLRDLRTVYMKASGVSVDWELLAQGAQGAKQGELLEVTKRCHPQTLRQVRWANGKLKETATQILVS